MRTLITDRTVKNYTEEQPMSLITKVMLTMVVVVVPVIYCVQVVTAGSQDGMTTEQLPVIYHYNHENLTPLDSPRYSF